MASADGRVVQRQVLFLGEINDRQQGAWRQRSEVFDEAEQRAWAFGNYWLGCELWEQMGLGEFWEARLSAGRDEVPWAKVLELLVVSRRVSPGSEFRLHRQGVDQSAMGDLLGVGFAVAEKDRFYRCLDRIVEHKAALTPRAVLEKLGTLQMLDVCFLTTDGGGTGRTIPLTQRVCATLTLWLSRFPQATAASYLFPRHEVGIGGNSRRPQVWTNSKWLWPCLVSLPY